MLKVLSWISRTLKSNFFLYIGNRCSTSHIFHNISKIIEINEAYSKVQLKSEAQLSSNCYYYKKKFQIYINKFFFNKNIYFPSDRHVARFTTNRLIMKYFKTLEKVQLSSRDNVNQCIYARGHHLEYER